MEDRADVALELRAVEAAARLDDAAGRDRAARRRAALGDGSEAAARLKIVGRRPPQGLDVASAQGEQRGDERAIHAILRG